MHDVLIIKLLLLVVVDLHKVAHKELAVHKELVDHKELVAHKEQVAHKELVVLHKATHTVLIHKVDLD